LAPEQLNKEEVMIVFSFVAPIVTFSYVGIKSWREGHPKEGGVYFAGALVIALAGASYMGVQIWNAFQDVVHFFFWIMSIALMG